MSNSTTRITQSYDVLVYIEQDWQPNTFTCQPTEHFRDASSEGWLLVQTGLTHDEAHALRNQLRAGQVTLEEVYELAG